jgi:hypothetical protein
MAVESQDLYDPLQTGPRLPDPVEYDTSIAGDQVLIYAEGSRPSVIIRTPRKRESWIAAASEYGWGQPEGIPTTIDYRGQFYEIYEVEKRGSYYEYYLAPLGPGQLTAVVISYSAEAERLRRRQGRIRRRARWIGNAMRLFAPLIGFLPGDLQTRYSFRFAIPLEFLNTTSCVVEALFALYLIVAGGVLRFISSLVENRQVLYLPSRILGLPSQWWFTVAPLIIVGSIWRWRRYQASGRPRGLLIFELLAKIVAP